MLAYVIEAINQKLFDIYHKIMYYAYMLNIPPALLYVLFIWSIIWKGLALWHAAKLNQKNWFVVMLVLNTIGIVEIVYLFFFAKKRFNLRTLRFWETWQK